MATTRNDDPNRFQFTLRTLLVIVTAVCLLFGLLEWVLPKDTSIEERLVMYVIFSAFTAYGVWTIYREQRRPCKTPANCVLVRVDAKWLRRVKSPFIFLPIAAGTGVSLTFAPFYLFWCGQVQEFGIFEWIVVPLCFLIIYFVPGFYVSLASEVIAELYRTEMPPSSSHGVESNLQDNGVRNR